MLIFAIFSDDYDTPDGTAIRDYIRVEDLAAAHIAALRCLLAGDDGDVVNLVAGTGYSVSQILNSVFAETGEVVLLLLHPGRAGAACSGWRPSTVRIFPGLKAV